MLWDNNNDEEGIFTVHPVCAILLQAMYYINLMELTVCIMSK